MMFNLTAVSCRTFSLGHMIINYVFAAVIEITNGDSNGGNEDGRKGVPHAAKLGPSTKQGQH